MNRLNGKKLLWGAAAMAAVAVGLRLAAQGQEGGIIGMLQVLAALGAVCAGAWLLAGKMGKGLAGKAALQEGIRIIDRKSLDKANTLVLVQVREDEFLLSCGAAGVSMMAEMGKRDETGKRFADIAAIKR